MRRWIVTFLVLVLILGAAQYTLQRQGEAGLQRFVNDSRSWATIKIGRARFWLWGMVELDDISIQPTAWLAGFYGLPLGYTVRIGRLHFHHFVPGWNDGLVLNTVDVDARHVHVPLPRWDWHITFARNRAGHRLWAPTLADLGISALNTNATGVLYFRDGLTRPELQWISRNPGLADIAVDCAVQVPKRITQNPAALIIRHCRMDYQDRGLVKHFQRVMARYNHTSVARLQTAITQQIARVSTLWRWQAHSRKALQSFVHAPEQPLRVEIHPAKPLSLEQIPRGVWPGLPTLLGLRVSLPAKMPEFEPTPR